MVGLVCSLHESQRRTLIHVETTFDNRRIGSRRLLHPKGAGSHRAGITDFSSRVRGRTNDFLTDLRGEFTFIEARDIRTPSALAFWEHQKADGRIDKIDERPL